MSKKGISPLITLVLIIGFTIAIASLILMWGSNLFEDVQEKTEMTSYESISCTMDAAIDIKNAYTLGNELRIMIENQGTKSFEGVLVRFIGSTQGDTYLINTTLESGGIEKFNAFFNPEIVGDLEEIEVFPVIQFEGKDVYCSNNKDSLKMVEEGSEFCENADPDLCGGLDILFGSGYRQMCCDSFGLCC